MVKSIHDHESKNVTWLKVGLTSISFYWRIILHKFGHITLTEKKENAQGDPSRGKI